MEEELIEKLISCSDFKSRFRFLDEQEIRQKFGDDLYETIYKEFSDNWSYERIGKVELISLKLGISELIMNLTPKNVVISEWVKITDKHSSSKGAKFVNGILDKISNEI